MNPNQDVTEDQFFEMVDRFISQANACNKEFPQSKISAAILFAAARFNAFNWVNRSTLPDQTLDEAALAFRAEYEAMFRDNAQGLIAMREKH